MLMRTWRCAFAARSRPEMNELEMVFLTFSAFIRTLCLPSTTLRPSLSTQPPGGFFVNTVRSIAGNFSPNANVGFTGIITTFFSISTPLLSLSVFGGRASPSTDGGRANMTVMLLRNWYATNMADIRKTTRKACLMRISIRPIKTVHGNVKIELIYLAHLTFNLFIQRYQRISQHTNKCAHVLICRHRPLLAR